MLTTKQKMVVDPPGAGASASGTGDADSGTYVTFELGGQVFGVLVENVREILDSQRITPVPNSPPDCKGVIDARGESIPITDLAARLGYDRCTEDGDARILVFELSSETGKRLLAVEADRVLDVLRIGRDDVEEPPDGITAGQADGPVIGIVRLSGELAILVDIDRLFQPGDQVGW